MISGVNLYYAGGNWNYQTKKWVSMIDTTAEFSLEDIKNLYSMVRLLHIMDNV